MRTPLAISVAIGTLALAFAAQALADGEPDLLAPSEGAQFTSGDVMTFRASPTNGGMPGDNVMNFYIWDQPPPATAQPTGHIDNFQGSPTPEDPNVFAGTPRADETWLKKPGTYFWQAVYFDCLQNPTGSCFVRSATWPIIINPLPASAVNSPSEIETFLDRKPRHRTTKRKVKFKFSSNVEGATFRCLFASGWADCDSPQVFRRLEPGRYRFKARAVVNDLKDPTPVKWVYRILRRSGGG